MNVALESGSLGSAIGLIIQENDNLVLGKELWIEVIPVLGGLKRESVLLSGLWEPRKSFFDVVDMSGVICTIIESNNLEFVVTSFGWEAQEGDLRAEGATVEVSKASKSEKSSCESDFEEILFSIGLGRDLNILLGNVCENL